MRVLVHCLFMAALVSSTGCSKKVSDENAKKVKPGMALSEVQALLGSGRKDGSGGYEWATEKGKLRLGFADNKVSKIEYEGAPKVESEAEKAQAKAIADAKWAEQKQDSERVAQDRDRINAMNDVYALLFAAVGAGDKLPASETAAAASPLAGVNTGLAAIRTGRVVVRWGADSADAVWAYEKDAPAKGGYAVGEKYTQAEKLTSEQLRPFVKR